MIYSTAITVGIITVAVFVVDQLNVLISTLLIHVIHYVLLEVLLYADYQYRELMFLICMSVCTAAGRMLISFWSTIACETCNTEMRGTSFTFLMVVTDFGGGAVHFLNSMLYPIDKNMALRVNNSIIFIAIGIMS